MVEWRMATAADIEAAVKGGMVEPTGLDEGDIRRMAEVGFARSMDCRAYFIDQELVCVVGTVVENLLDAECHLWATFLPASQKSPATIARWTREYVNLLMTMFERVTCLCDPGFTATLRWVKWMGFTRVGECAIMGKQYDLFERRA